VLRNFPLEDGACLQPDEFSKAFQRHVWAANLPRIPLHDLRYTWAGKEMGSVKHQPEPPSRITRCR
jgi:hypothetical protein